MKEAKKGKKYTLISWYAEKEPSPNPPDDEQYLEGDESYDSREKAVAAKKEKYDSNMSLKPCVWEDACYLDPDEGTAEFWWLDGWIRYWKIVEETA